MPLGHMLTFKVAYQIAAGLAYLHRKSIIFCDLKSDNILVWSLEVCLRFIIIVTCITEVGKLRRGGHMWPGELVNPAHRAFAVISPEAK